MDRVEVESPTGGNRQNKVSFRRNVPALAILDVQKPGTSHYCPPPADLESLNI